MSRPRAAGAVTTKCPQCGAPVYRQLVGAMAALDVTADRHPIPPADEPQLRTPWRLTWCLTQGQWRPTALHWRCPSRDCTHQVVIDHRCPPKQPTTLF